MMRVEEYDHLIQYDTKHKENFAYMVNRNTLAIQIDFLNGHFFFCFLIIDEIPCIVPSLIKQNIRYQKKTYLSDNHFSALISALKYQL